MFSKFIFIHNMYVLSVKEEVTEAKVLLQYMKILAIHYLFGLSLPVLVLGVI